MLSDSTKKFIEKRYKHIESQKDMYVQLESDTKKHIIHLVKTEGLHKVDVANALDTFNQTLKKIKGVAILSIITALVTLLGMGLILDKSFLSSPIEAILNNTAIWASSLVPSVLFVLSISLTASLKSKIATLSAYLDIRNNLEDIQKKPAKKTAKTKKTPAQKPTTNKPTKKVTKK